MIQNELIYDVGAHIGADAEFYLKKGFSVIAIEAVPELCDLLEKKFSGHVQTGQLRILNLAIADKSGTIDFYVHETESDWGTANLDWVARNKSLVSGSIRTIKVKSCSLGEIMKKHGVPRYCKIDIEGSDLNALKSLTGIGQVPTFCSIESEKKNWAQLIQEFEVFNALGYQRYKIIDQTLVNFQKSPNPPREGRYCDYIFEVGSSSGLFGDELPGRWLDSCEALEIYKHIFRGYFLNGDNGLFRTKYDLFHLLGRIQTKIVHLKGFESYIHPAHSLPPPGWYDTHSCLAY